jgi:hypothetical protein
MTKPKSKVVARPKVEITKEIRGKLVFQRLGQMATFKTVCKEVLSNPIVQFKGEILSGYDPKKHVVEGEFIYRFTTREK